MSRYIVRFARRAGIVILFLIAALLGTVSGIVLAFAGDLPRISALDDYAPSTITRVHGSHGEIVGEFSTQRRGVVPYDASPTGLRHAILSPEALRFDRHICRSIPHSI